MIQPPIPFTGPSIDTWRPSAPPDLSAFDEIELDCETTGLDRFDDRPVGLAIGTPKGTQYLPFAHRGGQNLDEAVVKRWAERELRGKRIRNLNTKFDLHQMASWGVDLRAQGNTYHDVAHSAALLDDHRKAFDLSTRARPRASPTWPPAPWRPTPSATWRWSGAWRTCMPRASPPKG